MSIIQWQSTAGGDWSTGADWTGGTSPGAGDDAVIDAAGSYTVTISTADAARSLTLGDSGATVADTGSLTLGGTLTLTAGTFQLDGSGSIAGGTLQASGGAFAWNGGTLDGVTYRGTLDLTPVGATLTIADGLTLLGANGTGSGTIDMTGSEGGPVGLGGISSVLTFEGTQTLDNATINMGADLSGTPDGYGFQQDNVPPPIIAIEALQGSNPILTLGPSLTINHTGSGNFIVLGEDSGNATIVNDGTINATASDPGFSITPPALGNRYSIIDEDFAIIPSLFINNGTITVANGDLLDIGGSSVSVDVNSPGAPETFINNGTITVSGGALQIDALNWMNNGTISVDQGRLLVAGSLATIGTISVTNSFVTVANTTTARLSSLFGGRGNGLSIAGTLDNRGQTLDIGTGSSFTQLICQDVFDPGTILGGTIRDTGSGLISGGYFQGAGTLDGVTYDGTIDLTNFFASLNIEGGFRMHGTDGTGTGTINLGGDAVLTFLGTQTVDGATINAQSDAFGFSVPGIVSSGGTLTLGRNLTILEAQNDVDLFCDGLVNDGNIEASSITATGFTNNGTILMTADTAAVITATNFVNNGIITLFGEGTLAIATTSAINNGTLTDRGGEDVVISADLFTNNGTIEWESAGAGAGQLTIAAPLDGDGRISLGTGSTLELTSSCSADQTILFEDNQADVLRLDDPAAFHGTILGFGPGDTIDLAGISASSAVYQGNMIVVSLSGGGAIDLKVFGNTSQGASFALAPDGSGGTDLTVVPGQTFTLTTRPDTIDGSHSASNTIIATAGTLSAGDRIDAGLGTSRLVLQGGGTFDLRAPTSLGAPGSLTGIAIIDAQEGQGGDRQTVYLRAGTNAIVAVASAVESDLNAPAPGITIYGGNADMIELGNGNDTVYLGGPDEAVFGGGGDDVFIVTGGIISAGGEIHAGSGRNILEVTGGGGGTMQADITGITSVWLEAAPAGQTQQAYQFTANGIQGLEIVDKSNGDDRITIGDASQIVRAGNGNITIQATAADAGALLLLGSGHNVLEITTGGTAVINPLTSNITVELDGATNLTLNGESGVTAIGSAGADTITAKATGQTLTGNGGGDTLIGYVGGGDLFRDTTAGFGGAALENFAAAGDAIDITDLGFGANTTLGYSQGSGEGVLSLSDGTHDAFIALFGQFAAAGFHTASDGGAGTMITYTAPPHTDSPVIAAARG